MIEVRNRLKPYFQGLTRMSPTTIKWLFLLGGTSLFVGLFIALTSELHEDQEIDAFDKWFMRTLVLRWRHDSWNGIAVDFTSLGSTTVLTVVVLSTLLVLYLLRDKIASLYLTLGALGAALWTVVLKATFVRERPTIVPRLVEVEGFSYPSGHSLGAAAIYLLLVFLSFRYFRRFQDRALIFLCAFILIFLVCFSRVYLGVHYPSDVASGALLGASWTFFLTALYSWTRRSKKPKLPNPQK